MTEASPSNLELALVLPLGVVANQLMRIEADLRFLNMRTLAHAQELESGSLARKIAAPLDRINEALDLIRGLVADIRADVRPGYAAPTLTSSADHSSRKRLPDRDD
jgi:hypothetical protein